MSNPEHEPIRLTEISERLEKLPMPNLEERILDCEVTGEGPIHPPFCRESLGYKW